MTRIKFITDPTAAASIADAPFVDIVWGQEALLQAIDQHIKEIHKGVIIDEAFKEILQTQLESYLQGEVTLEEAVEAVSARMELD